MCSCAEGLGLAFDDDPMSEDERRRFPIIRAPQKGATSLIVLSNYYRGIWTHWLGSRGVGCRKGECEACEKLQPRRWYGYVAVQGVRSGEIGFAEITPPCIDAFVVYRKRHGSVRGAAMQLCRTKEKKNGMVQALLRPSSGLPLQLPAAPDVEAFIARIYELLPSNVDRVPNVPRETIVATATEKLVQRSPSARLKQVAPTSNGSH